MIENKEEKELISDRDSWYGRTSKARSTATKEKTSRQSSRKSSVSQSQMPLMCLCLIRENGPTQDSCSMRWGGYQLPGGCTMLNTGVYPSVVRESRLSRILEDCPPTKYYLSKKACLGILTRAARRGKELPPELKAALIAQSM